MLNSCHFIGRLGQDPEVRYTQKGSPTASFNLAVSETWTKDGEKKEKTEWIRIVAWERLAEICGQYLTKGSLVFIEGKFQTRKWTDKDGQERYTTEINAKTMKMLSSRKDGQHEADTGHDASQAPADDDDVPF